MSDQPFSKNLDGISARERRRYVTLQIVCWILVFASVIIFVDIDQRYTAKVVALVFALIFLLGAVIFNWGRRFGIRILWSKRFRE